MAMAMAMATSSSPAKILWLLVFSSAFLTIIYASELFLEVDEPTTLQLSPSLVVENSPGTNPGSKVKCERVHVHGLPRMEHLKKFANSVKVNVSLVNPRGRLPNVEVCFHRNASLGIGMCPQGVWERLTKGVWVKPMSPFDHKMLDIRIGASYSESLQVSLSEEFFSYRVWFLVWGIILLTLASWISNSIVFYYSGAMAVGILLVILMVLFQGMKLLPTGRKSSLAIFLYSCFVGVGSYLLSYVPRLLRSLLIEIGLSEEMHDPLAIFLLLFFVIPGAWLGFWVVRKFVITEEGSVDVGVAHFVTWAIRIVASLMILQSSVDPLLAVEALVGGIFVSLVLRRSINPEVVHRAYKKLHKLDRSALKESRSPYSSPVNNFRSFTRTPYSPVPGSTSKSPPQVSNSNTFYSTFHDTPDRKKFSKEEWEQFTKDSTRKALEGLVSSPDFSKWAVKHADRITLAPKQEIAVKQHRWFSWF